MRGTRLACDASGIKQDAFKNVSSTNKTASTFGTRVFFLVSRAVLQKKKKTEIKRSRLQLSWKVLASFPCCVGKKKQTECSHTDGKRREIRFSGLVEPRLNFLALILHVAFGGSSQTSSAVALLRPQQ